MLGWWLMMLIRPIKVADNQAVKAILKADLEDAGMAIPGTAYYDTNLDTLSQYYHANPHRMYYVAVADDGTVLGGAGFGEFDLAHGVAELQKLYLAKTARGHGLSYQLISLIEDAAKTAGYQRLYLETDHRLPAAVHIYEKTGYTQLTQPLKDSPHNACDLYYVKNL